MGAQASEEAWFVRSLVEQAGTLAVAARSTLVRELKADQSLVTNVDRAVEQFLREGLASRFPGDDFYGEETGGDPSGRRVWIADPIDGTINYASGLPCWGVSLGLAAEGAPVLGAFHLPATGETFWFEAGRGAWRNDEPLWVPPGGPLHREDPVAIGSEALPVLDLTRFPARQRNLGSLAAHWCYTASGALRACVSVWDHLHDVGAAFGLALEAGCVIEYLDGGSVPFAAFLRDRTNLRPLVVGGSQTVAHIREVLQERPSGIDDLE